MCSGRTMSESKIQCSGTPLICWTEGTWAACTRICGCIHSSLDNGYCSKEATTSAILDYWNLREPIRHGKLPPNIVEAARANLEAGGKTEKDIVNSTLGLVCSGRVPRECGVQIP